MKLKIASYNIWHGQNYAKKLEDQYEMCLDKIADYMVDNDIAICGMNEVDANHKRSGFVNEPETICNMLMYKTKQPYYSAFGVGLAGYHHLGSLYGNAIVSRYPLENVRVVHVSVHEIDENDPKTQAAKGGWERRAIVMADVSVEGKPLTVMTAHFGLQFEERVKMMDTVEELVKEIKNPIVFMGDFNTTPGSDIYKRIAAIFKDTSEDPEVPLTFQSMNPRAKIDYIFTSEDIKASDVETVPLTWSDHLPLQATIEW